MTATPGTQLRDLSVGSQPLPIAGTINAYCALLAQRAGFTALYLSGAGVANADFGLPDLGLTSRADVVETARRITSAVPLPLLVDADTGWEDEPGGIGETIRQLSDVKAAGCHLEDQIPRKRCGHRAGKQLVSANAARDRIAAAVEGRRDTTFVIMARTDAYSVEGLDAAIARAQQYVEAGADMIFAEAMQNREEYRTFCSTVSVPVLANITEFGVTPLMPRPQLQDAGVSLALYPLSAFRAMSQAAESVYRAILSDGSQQAMLGQMQTREQLYEVLNYEQQEQRIDQLLAEARQPSDGN
ncbi:MAG: methylisocitrate lyase [Planctomycetaceae bacterium]|nr:methylisocitrate lyase [Planctomycetaceae bacterium]